MKFLLGLMICVATYSTIFGDGLTLAPGVSVKNALTYLALMLLILESALGRPLKSELRAVQIWFAVLVGYGMLSLIFITNVVKYEHYDVMGSIIWLKSNLLDWAVVFLAFLYGTRSAEEAQGLIKVLLAGVSIANIYTIGCVVGIPPIGIDPVGFDTESAVSRVNGIFGHANETGTMIACLLPAYIPIVESAKGKSKYLWMALMMSSVIVLFMTGSRGALVGLFLGCVWAAILCRRYLSWDQTLRWTRNVLAILVPVTIIAGVKYWDMVVHRFTSVSLTSANDVSSGRTDLWAEALGRMMQNPITFVTGYGWNVWSVMGFAFVAHNQYLSLFFELGQVGLISFILIYRNAVVTALSAAAVADAKTRPYLVASVFGLLALCASMLFATLFTPWFFIWAYIGLTMRCADSTLALHKRTRAAAKTASAAVARAPKRNRVAGSTSALTPKSPIRR